MSNTTCNAADIQLMMSPTLNTLAGLAMDCPLDLAEDENAKAALASMVHALIEAIDAGRIQCAEVDDFAVLHGLLMVALEVATDGGFGRSIELVSLQ